MNYKIINNGMLLYFIIYLNTINSLYIDTLQNDTQTYNIISYHNNGIFPIWNKSNITWKYVENQVSLDKKIDPYKIEYYLETAFLNWNKKIGKYIKFIKLYYRDSTIADINISFENIYHNDYNFTSGSLAHAYYPGPGLGGDIHFNSEIDWKLNTTDLSFYLVTVHEIGHSLGLSHTDDPNSVMYPIFKHNSTITQENINEFKFLYNIPTSLSESDIIKIYKNHNKLISTTTNDTKINRIERNIYKKIKKLINTIFKKINDSINKLYNS
ncbi:zinc-dependent metalloprotease [Alphaentomopoxvirus acuprea]|uniref:Zinc-dependent metalloprotease n=1 Tax=Alphaentomopoxvirus acuprea TaxID=62099 RepID=W6JIV8_9POXV|nr:zinc-dependent metalloprotease [Anomala cuprea entomopoxvirus]BAO49528.1 zinc-dependent metalloprotease [Anomala cuprea entomopoxvirus]